MPSKQLTITVHSDSPIEVETNFGDVVPGVRVTQYLEVREYGVLGSSPLLPLYDTKYWPVALVMINDGMHAAKDMDELVAHLNKQYPGEVEEKASDWNWNGTAFERTLLTRQAGPPRTIEAYVISAMGKFVPRHDFMQLVDESEKPVQCWPNLRDPNWMQRYRDTPTVQFADGLKAYGLMAIQLELEKRYPAKVPSGLAGEGLPVKWQYGENRFYPLGGRVFTRLVVSGDLSQTPDLLQVKVLKSWDDDEPILPLVGQTAQVYGSDGLVTWSSAEGRDWLPLVTIGSETIAGIHGRNVSSGRQMGMIDWLMKKYPPDDFTDANQHWQWKDRTTFSRMARTDKPQITIQASNVLWEEE
jgi:hypothetical protein